MTSAAESEQSPEPVQSAGWGAIREIMGDFLIVFFGTWLLARGLLSLIATFSTMEGPPVLFMIFQLGTAIGMVSLGVDRWHAHSKAGTANIPQQPRRRRWYDDDEEEEAQ